MQCLIQLLIGWIVLLAGYGFTDQFKPLSDFEFSTPNLQIRKYAESGKLETVVSNRFRGTWLESIPVLTTATPTFKSSSRLVTWDTRSGCTNFRKKTFWDPNRGRRSTVSI